MKYEPPVDRGELIASLVQAYGIRPQRLDFIPLGFAAACYRVQCAGDDYFLKRWPKLETSIFEASSESRGLRLMQALQERELLAVPGPLPGDDGRLWTEHAGMPMALYPFVHGRPAPPEIPEWFQPVFGRTLARLHAATPHIPEDVRPAREAFDLVADVVLDGALPRVGRIGSGDRVGLRKLVRFFEQYGLEVEATLERLRAVRARCLEVADRSDWVLCHHDFGGDNLILDGETVWVLDWDYAFIAPPEFDLWSVVGLDWSTVGERFQGVLDAYLEAGGSRNLHTLHFEFCLLRRALSDMAARVARLLEPDNDGAEDEELLRGMVEFGVDRWREVDRGLAAFERTLQERRLA